MSLPKIEAADYATKGIRVKNNPLGLPVAEAQRAFDELSLDVIIPKVNALAAAQDEINDKTLLKGNTEKYEPTLPYEPATVEFVQRNAVEGGVPPTRKINGKTLEKDVELTAQDVGALEAVSGAGAHNSVYRGKYLGTAVTEAQWAAIKAGTFDDLYIGDYWNIGGTVYRIAAFDYYYQTGDSACILHHVTLVPDGNMYTHVMNDTAATAGAYVGSKMYTEGLTQAKETINSAFGEAHLLSHRQYLQNAVTNGYTIGGSWYDSTVELMTEQNIYGGKIYGNQVNGTARPDSTTLDKSQYPLFAFRPDLIGSRQNGYWLRDVVSALDFAYVNHGGCASAVNASNEGGVRPAFSIIG